MQLLAFLCIAVLLGSGMTIQLFVLPALIGRVQDRSTVSRVAAGILKGHHTIAVLLLAISTGLLFAAAAIPAAVLTGLLLGLNLYQRFWVFTKMHLVKQPIGVQDLIQPDNVLREEFNRLHRIVYIVFRLHVALLLIDLCLAAF